MDEWDLVNDQDAPSLDLRQLRQALGSFPTGVCLATTLGPDGKRQGMTINSFASVSLVPPLVLWNVRNDARSAQAFASSRSFVINVLGVQHRALAAHFAQPSDDKFAAHASLFSDGPATCPMLKDAIASYECITHARHQEGDHTVLVGRVEAFSHRGGRPLMFHAGQMGSMEELAALQAGRPAAA